MATEQGARERAAVDRAEAYAKSLHTTPEEHGDIMAAVNLARIALANRPQPVEVPADLAGLIERLRASAVDLRSSLAWAVGETASLLEEAADELTLLRQSGKADNKGEDARGHIEKLEAENFRLRDALKSVRLEIGPTKAYAEECGLDGGKFPSAVHIKLDLIDGYARTALNQGDR